MPIASHKRDNDKQRKPWSDATERNIWLGYTMFAFNTGISLKNGNNNN